MDCGLCPGNYFDYDDDSLALNRETDIAEELESTKLWEDPAFPPDGRSLYFDPLNPPKGALPQNSVSWCRINKGEVLDCVNPITFACDRKSSQIAQGALGNSYFVNCLRLFACQPQYIRRLIVSDKYAAQGIYTFKFCKYGKWRYVHVDDRIPCRQSGRVHFCRNENPEETFAMLMEKAYAKLHGCYESLIYGIMEKTIPDLTPAAHVGTLRSEYSGGDSDICDVVWRALESAMDEEKLVGCTRYVPDPYTENHSDRMGITLGCVYQVVDVCLVAAEATADLDALEVGLVCVRNVQKGVVGRFNGRWSTGHVLWYEYPEIARDVSARAKELLAKSKALASMLKQQLLAEVSGQTTDANAVEGATATAGGGGGGNLGMSYEDRSNLFYLGDEEESLESAETSEPRAPDLHWIQIEDFVDVFNRVYVVTDPSWDSDVRGKRYCGKWLPGDDVSGCGGPPVKPVESEQPPALPPGDEKTGKAAGEEIEEELPPASFLDNPMYPFSVSATTNISITVFQSDRRWSVGRIDLEPRDVCVADYKTRGDRLSACMRYDVGLGFVIQRLPSMAKRATKFDLNAIQAASEYVEFSNTCSGVVKLLPGIYVLVPFTDAQLVFPVDYVLDCKYKSGAVDFDLDDIFDGHKSAGKKGGRKKGHKKDALDKSPSKPADSSASLKEGGGGTAELSASSAGLDSSPLLVSGRVGPAIRIPVPFVVQEWEWLEDAEDVGMTAVFDQVADLANYIRLLRKDVRRLEDTSQVSMLNRQYSTTAVRSEPNRAQPSRRSSSTKNLAKLSRSGSQNYNAVKRGSFQIS